MAKDNFVYQVMISEDTENEHVLFKRSLKGHYVDSYKVKVNAEIGDDILDHMVDCSCMGFRVQKYAKVQHKHVRIVIMHMQMNELDRSTGWFELAGDNTPRMIQAIEVPEVS